METASSITPARFFTLTFLFSWLIWIPLALAHFGTAFDIPEATSAVIRLLGVLMPAASALTLTGLSSGRGALRQLISRLGFWQADLRSWLAAVALQPLLLVAAGILYNLFTPRAQLKPETVNIAWFFNRSRGSLFLPVPFHLTFNIVNTALLPVTLSIGAFSLLLVMEWGLMLLLLPKLEACPIS